MGDRLMKGVIAVVTLVWAANFLTPLWNPDYKPIPELNMAFMTIVGGLLLAKGGQNNSNQPPPPPEPPQLPTQDDTTPRIDQR